MKKLLCIVVAMLTIVGREVYAQTDPKEEQRYLQMLTPPGVSDLFRAHMADVSLYTGKMNFSIPLYEIKDPDFPLTISLDYNAEGFKPRKHSGIAGYNWVLNAGGCITREVNLYPDEVKESYNTHKGGMGMLEFLRHETPSPDSVFAFARSVFPTTTDTFVRTIDGKEYDIDYQPDIFHFDFCGYHGSFMVDNYGRPTIINGDYVEVDLSQSYQHINHNVTAYQSIFLPDTISKIIFHTIDGYTYEFGGDPSNVGCSVSYKTDTSYPFSTPNPIINSWYLNKIIAPNGRTLIFYYKPIAREPIPVNSPLWLYSKEYLPGHFLYWSYDNLHAANHSRVDLTAVSPVSTITKECLIDSIKVSGEHPLKISFSYQTENTSMYPYLKYRITNSRYLSSKNYQLNNMQVSSGENILKNISFTHETKAGRDSYSWRFLKSISIDGIGVYSMKYNHPGIYPSLEDNAPDGYFLCYDMDGYWDTYSLRGLLSEITYPTGGKQTFSYESHVYDVEHYYEAGSEGDILFRTGNLYDPINGARITQITTYDKNEVIIEKRKYSYLSGVYFNKHKIKVAGYNNYLLIDNLCAYDLVGSSIGYPQVVEKVYSVKDLTETLVEQNKYYFSYDEDAMSTIGSLNKIYDWDDIVNDEEREYSYEDYYRAIPRFLMFGDRLITFGKLVEKDVLISTGASPIQKEYYYYNNCSQNSNLFPPSIIPQMPKDTITIYSCLLGIPLTRRLYTYPDVFTQKNICSYSGNNELHKTEAYYHDEKQRITKQITFDSDNIEHFTYYRYPDELHAIRLSTDVSARALYMLTQKGQVSKPIETYSGVKMQNTEYVTSGSVTKYFTDLPLHVTSSNQWRNHHVYPSQVYSLALATPVSNYQPSYISVGLLKIDNHYQLSKSYQLDSLLRPISVTPVGGPTTTYTWNGFYPDSVTVGSQITTYTSIPHVGITSITDPKGLTTYYSYDAYGRLVEVYHMFDNVKQIINAYNYHISNE